LEKTEGAIKNGQSINTVNTGHTRHSCPTRKQTRGEIMCLQRESSSCFL